MATCKATYRHYLLNGYGTSPLDASIQFFAVNGNGMEWINGDLVPSYDINKVRSFDDYYKANYIDDATNLRLKLENEAPFFLDLSKRVQNSTASFLDSDLEHRETDNEKDLL